MASVATGRIVNDETILELDRSTTQPGIGTLRR
jgi:hypothetical protein